jgi:hypothetical protein
VRFRIFAIVTTLCALLAACGSGGGSKGASSGSGSNQTLVAETASYDVATGGPERFIVGLLTKDQRQVSFGTVQVRFCYLGTAQGAQPCRPGASQAATFLPVPGSPPGPAESTPQILGPTQTKGVYSTVSTFDKAGFWRAEVSADLGGKTSSATTDFQVLDHHKVLAPGDAAPPLQNLTMSTPGAAPAAIDSRASAGGLVPDQDLHQSTVAAALAAHHPIVVVFATPVYCQSRFCGPTTDAVEALAKKYPDRATFIHVEIWADYSKQQLNPGLDQWIGDNEPWIYFIGADGKIVDRWDNVADTAALETTLEKLPVIGKA